MVGFAADVPGLRRIRGCRTVTAEGAQWWRSHGPPTWVPSGAAGRCKTGAWVVESAISVPVDGLGVEAALDARRERAGAVGVERDVGDRLGLRAVAVALGDERARFPAQAVGRGVHRDAGEQLRLRADLRRRADDGAGRAVGRARVEAVARAEAVLVRGDDLHVERGDAELLGDDLRVVVLVAVRLRGEAQDHLAGRVHAQEHRAVCLVRHRVASSLYPSSFAGASRARRWRSWCAVSALWSSRSQNAGCGPPSGCGGAAGRSQPG